MNQMEQIVMINGHVSFPITLDATVWIFDERKVDLTTLFTSKGAEKSDDYVEAMSRFWDRELLGENGNASIRAAEKEQLITGSYGIPLNHFLQHAKPKEGATSLEVITATGSHLLSLQEAKEAVLGFSKDGKPLRDDGPIHIHVKGRTPITYVRVLTVK
jgi:hypothetical protein